MNFLDWIALVTFLGSLVGLQVSADPATELERATSAQASQAASAEAEVDMGGHAVMRFANSGATTAMERAVEAKQNLGRVIAQDDLPGHYVGLGLRVGGDDALATLNYFDLPITTVTKTDAKANGFNSPKALAERWKSDVDTAIHALPGNLPVGWIAARGKPTPSLLVSDPTLSQAVADLLPDGTGQRVTVSAQGGTVILDGQVADEHERGRLVRLVRGVPGVRDVIDHTSVQQ